MSGPKVVESHESVVIQGRRTDSGAADVDEREPSEYKRDHLRYPSDLTDEEWAHVEPLIPPARQGGRKRETNMREALNAVMYGLSAGRQWRYLPKDLPPRSTVYRYFRDWSIDGVLDCIHDALYEKCRAQAEREASPTAAIIDSQSVRSAEKGGLDRSARSLLPG